MNNPNHKRHFAPGDVVALKSGSSRMTVVAVIDDNARVVWSDYETKEIRDMEFPLVVLVHTS
jgi:uncharacterized protein YodC (DUF2158 family)